MSKDDENTRIVAHAFGWWLRKHYDSWSLTWAPLGFTVVVIEEATLVRLAQRLPEIPDRVRLAKEFAIADRVERDRPFWEAPNG